MHDFLFEDKGCTMITCFGLNQISEVDALRAVFILGVPLLVEA